MKKILLLLLMIVAYNVQATADNLLIVETNDGGKVSFELSSSPEITFNGQTMQVNTVFKSQSFEIANVAQYYFKSILTGMKDLQQGELRLCQPSNDKLVIDGLHSSSNVRLYSIDGKDLSDHISVSDGKAVISLLSLPKGVYIISANKSQNIKIYKR